MDCSEGAEWLRVLVRGGWVELKTIYKQESLRYKNKEKDYGGEANGGKDNIEGKLESPDR